MAMPAPQIHRWTADEVRALPDEPGKRFECVDGELLVSSSPRLPHQAAVSFLLHALYAYCRASAASAAFTAPGDLELDHYTLVQPDLFVLPLVDGRTPLSQESTGHPLLFIEVLSPSTARFDRVVKRRRYQRYGVECWIVDLDARLVERWTPDIDRPEIVSELLTWQPMNALTAFTLDLPAMFAEVLGER